MREQRVEAPRHHARSNDGDGSRAEGGREAVATRAAAAKGEGGPLTDAGDPDLPFMRMALEEARAAAREGEVPVGAVLVHGGGGDEGEAGESSILARTHNLRESRSDALAHAEMLALAEASRAIRGWRLDGCTLYVTLEPCAMCAGALVQSRVDRLVYGAADPKAGFCGSLGDLVRDPRLNHRLEVRTGLLAEESSELLRTFFAGLRRRS